MSEAFNNVCRTCLSSGSALLSLLENNIVEASSSIADMLKSFTSVIISDSDGLPSKVCLSCISEINSAYAFKIKCENSELTLKQYLNQQNGEIKITKFEKAEENDIEMIETLEELSPSKDQTEDDEKLFTEEGASEEISNEDKNCETNVIEVPKKEYHEDDDSSEKQEVFVEQNVETPIENDILFECRACGKQFKIKEKFTAHSVECCMNEKKNMEYKEKNRHKEPIQCPHCPVDFVHKKNLDKHVQKYHRDLGEKVKIQSDEEKQSENEDSDSAGSNVDNIQANVIKHEIVELPESNFHCKHCNAGFAKEISLVYHIKINKCTEKQFQCDICKRVFINRKNLSRHIKLHSKQVLTCSKCPRTFSRQDKLTEHMNVAHRGIIKNQCPICSKVFTMVSTLKDHLRIHNGEKPFLCSICGKGFSQGTNLKQHTMRHTNTKPFKCNICDYTSVSKGELNAHIRKHTGDHPFVCDTCGSGFTTSSSLVKHKRIHTGERPYACDFCPMRFTALGTLKNHRRTHTGEKPFVCKYCERGFAQKSDCVSHVRTHTGERPYMCPICGLSFQQSGTLKSHSQIHARESKAPKRKKSDDNSNTTNSSIEKADTENNTTSESELFTTQDEILP